MYNRLKDLREDKEKLQKEIGEMLGTTANYYGEYETGKRDIPFQRVIQLAEYYNVSIDYIAGRTNDKGGLHIKDKEIREIIEIWKELNEDEKEEIKNILFFKIKKKKKKI